MEIKRGNGLRPQHIEQQYIAGTAGEVGRGIVGERFPLEKEIELFFQSFCVF